ncbi:hypothetical protein HJB88_14630 [Rhizobium sp. NZLR5]|uniref:hypothetical protein n=1 Tax=Rhizobium sp. NZLR5 TaxID=2731103 RepID=UPI001C82A315|nr:hypothetical protein [Rhizobium sp. NZLR5]MBX5183859.1 hypothetical protein [Rhizobium sp. NZLR5]
MKKIALALMLVLAASPALAISRYNPLTMSCANVRAAIHNRGAVIFRYQSPRGSPLYDRYVRNSNYCDATDYAEWTHIPSKDNPRCQVLNCQNIDNLDGMLFVPDYQL